MKWIKNLKTSNNSWLAHLCRLTSNTNEKADDNVMINDCFATYLQKMATDKIKPIPSDENLLSKEYAIISEPNTKQADKLLKVLSPLKQAV